MIDWRKKLLYISGCSFVFSLFIKAICLWLKVPENAIPMLGGLLTFAVWAPTEWLFSSRKP